MSVKKGINYRKFYAMPPEDQRKAIAEARKRGDFDAQELLESSPIGRAVAKGFPSPTSNSNNIYMSIYMARGV